MTDHRQAGLIASKCLQEVVKIIKPGTSLIELDKFIENFILENKAKPAFKNYNNYPFASCISINKVVVHGLPTNYKIKQNDVVKIDIGVLYKDKIVDTALTYTNNQSKQVANLIKATKEALKEGIKQCVPGNKTGDISSAIENVVNKYKLGVPYELSGHGIGKTLHESPSIFNYGKPGTGAVLKEGMVIAIEPMFSLSSDNANSNQAAIEVLNDNWSIAIKNGSISAHFEHTVEISKNGPMILTNPVDTKGLVW